MDHDEALRLLALSPAADAADLRAAFARQSAPLQERIEGAPTEALREKYRRQLAELEEARRLLLGAPAAPGGLSQTKIADLPLAQASYGASASGRSGGVSLQPGRLLSGRYEIQEQIGTGGMGAVYRAYDKNREKDIAIKVLLPHLLASPAARERFLKEARLASEMSHPNIVTVFDVQQDGAYCFLTMELLRGKTLRTALTALRQQRRPMPVEEALRIVDHIGHALAYAHEKTVHRDVKPENIWLGDDGRAKLMDFGIARLVADAQAGQTSLSAGTAYYMAPEQLAGRADVDGRADQYALAATLYEMLAGHVPTGRIESLSRLRHDVPAALSMAVDRALAVRPEARFARMEDFRTGLYRSKALSLHGVPVWARAAAAAALLGVLVVFGWPTVASMLPDREAEERAKEDALRLQAEAKAMFRQLDSLRREVRDAAANAARDIERLEGQSRSTRSDEERLQAQLALMAARAKAEITAEIEHATLERLDSGNGVTALEGSIAAADSLLKDQKLDQAQAHFRAVMADVQRLRAIPEETHKRILADRARVLGQLDGKWGLDACQGASSWTVKGEELHVFWPGAGMFEAAVTHIGKGMVTVTVTSPASHKGRHYRYILNGQRLEVEELSKGVRQQLQRCA